MRTAKKKGRGGVWRTSAQQKESSRVGIVFVTSVSVRRLNGGAWDGRKNVTRRSRPEAAERGGGDRLDESRKMVLSGVKILRT